MNGPGTTSHGGISCAEVADLAGLYVLDALDAADQRRVAAHLASCPEAHAEVAELGSVVPALSHLAEPMDAPPELKARVMDAYRREAAPAPRAARSAEIWEMPVTRPRPVAQRPWLGWAATAAAVLVVAVVGAWGLAARADADRSNQRAAELGNAIAAMSAPGSSVAILRGTGSAAAASGFAAFPEAGGGYVVMLDLPHAPAGQTYQAWYIAEGTPASAGLLTVGADGYAILADARPVPGTSVVALTLEPAGGSAAPTSDPIAVGEVATPG